jgi:uncharacterized protein (TIGR00255 family)
MSYSVYSMTGYAIVKDHLGFTIDIRCVNSRFLDVSFKIPDTFKHLEAKFKEKLVPKIRRGKCEFKLSFLQNSSINSAPYTPQVNAIKGSRLDLDVVKSLLNDQAVIQSIAPQAASLTVAEILQLSLAEQKHSNSVDLPHVSDQVLLDLCDAALKELNMARALEGANLAEAMLEGVRRLGASLAELLPIVPTLVEHQKARFMQKFHDVLSGNEDAINPIAAQDRALVEVTAFAIRIDITEEVDRLRSHLTEVEKLLKNGGTNKVQEIGKRLEFFIQELHREVNTVGSKSASLAGTKIALEMKVIIEQLREQVQNIE